MNDNKDFVSRTVHLPGDPDVSVLNQSVKYKNSLQNQRRGKNRRKKENAKSKIKTILWFLGLIVLNTLLQVIGYYGNYDYYTGFEFNWGGCIWGSVLYCVFSLIISALSDRAKNPEKYKTIDKARTELRQKQIKEIKKQTELNKTNIPKCPTCGSTNIEKISSFNKAAGAVMFGLFSKTARSQFKCRDCGYKW